MPNNPQRGNNIRKAVQMEGEELQKKKLADAGPVMTNSVEEQHLTATEDDASGIPNFSQLPAPWAQNCKELWQEGAQTVKRPDGSFDNWDVVDWLLTRKGGAGANWTELDEAQKAIEAMRQETIDFNRIREHHELEEERRQRQEERRLANKKRYRPRSEWERTRNGRIGENEDPSFEAQEDFRDGKSQIPGSNGDREPKDQANAGDKHE